IVAIGLYELFIDPTLPMPPWLRINTLDDLKERLLGLVAVLLAVTFLGSAVTWDGTSDILALGIAVGVVMGVVSATIAVLTHRRSD
ncbi:MAG: YqhA family protein, partial [Chloroflexi bacterium]|nr:YqhA family protein [Chloroflexota bacterium]